MEEGGAGFADRVGTDFEEAAEGWAARALAAALAREGADRGCEEEEVAAGAEAVVHDWRWVEVGGAGGKGSFGGDGEVVVEVAEWCRVLVVTSGLGGAGSALLMAVSCSLGI